MALVGYTNAGKSTLMNKMVETYVGKEEKMVMAKDMLFATLDTTCLLYTSNRYCQQEKKCLGKINGVERRCIWLQIKLD